MITKSTLISQVMKSIADCDDLEILQEVQVGKGQWQNELVLFMKPEVFLVAQRNQVEQTLDLTLNKLHHFDAHVNGAVIMGGKALERLGIMSRHYGLINRLSRSASKMLSADDKANLIEVLGIPHDEAESYDILGGHEYLVEYPEETGPELDNLWFAGKSIKIRSGFYVRQATKMDRKLILVNAFHPEQLAHFTNPSHRIVLFLIHSDTDWKVLKNDMVGATFPDKAVSGSIRGMLHQQPHRYGFERVSIANNAVHLSAGPFEGMFEIVNFFGDSVGIKPESTPPLVIKRMLEQGVDFGRAIRVLDNPLSKDEQPAIDLFTATEDMNTDQAIEVWKKRFNNIQA